MARDLYHALLPLLSCWNRRSGGMYTAANEAMRTLKLLWKGDEIGVAELFEGTSIEGGVALVGRAWDGSVHRSLIAIVFPLQNGALAPTIDLAAPAWGDVESWPSGNRLPRHRGIRRIRLLDRGGGGRSFGGASPRERREWRGDRAWVEIETSATRVVVRGGWEGSAVPVFAWDWDFVPLAALLFSSDRARDVVGVARELGAGASWEALLGELTSRSNVWNWQLSFLVAEGAVLERFGLEKRTTGPRMSARVGDEPRVLQGGSAVVRDEAIEWTGSLSAEEPAESGVLSDPEPTGAGLRPGWPGGALGPGPLSTGPIESPISEHSVPKAMAPAAQERVAKARGGVGGAVEIVAGVVALPFFAAAKGAALLWRGVQRIDTGLSRGPSAPEIALPALLPPPPPWVTAYRPSWVAKRRQSTFYVYVLLPELIAEVRREAQAALGRPGNRAREAHPVPLRRSLTPGERLCVDVQLPGFEVELPEPEPWAPPALRLLIPITAGADVAFGEHRPVVSVRTVDRELLARLDFDLEVRASSPRRSLLRAGLASAGVGATAALTTAVTTHAVPPELGWPASAVCLTGGIAAAVGLRPEVVPAAARDLSRVFISYAREDSARVRRVVDLLKAAGHFPWIDVDGILGGEVWEKRLEDEIDRADRFFLFWSSYARSSVHVKREWERAVARVERERLGGSFLVPVMLDGDRPGENHPLSRFHHIVLEGP